MYVCMYVCLTYVCMYVCMSFARAGVCILFAYKAKLVLVTSTSVQYICDKINNVKNVG